MGRQGRGGGEIALFQRVGYRDICIWRVDKSVEL